MKICNMFYFNNVGEKGYAGTPDEPYSRLPGRSRLAYSLFNENSGIGWSCQYEQGECIAVELQFGGGCRAIVDDDNQLVIAIGARPPMIVWPKDAAVFDPDGSLNHVIDLPDFVEHDFNGCAERFKVDGFTDVRLESNKVVIGIRFAHDWFQSRIYDAVTKQWVEVIAVGRI